MRLDLLLKQSGLIKRRTIAKELADKERILVNGKIAKPSFEVKENDELTLKLGSRILTVKIHYIEKFKKPFPTYEEISSIRIKDENA